MGFLSPAAMVVENAAAAAFAPPPPPDLKRWAEDNIVFDERSPIPGRFSTEKFPFLDEILECLSPEHPAREVTLRGDAQWGKTSSVIHPTLGAWFEYAPLDALMVCPTGSAANEWSRRKWMPLRKSSPSLRAMFGSQGGDKTDTLANQESLDHSRSLKVAASGSPSDLTATSRKLVIMDDLSKFVSSDMGDPEAMAESRASGYEDAKILRASTAMLSGTCRITRAYTRGDMRLWHVPCPHCGHMMALTWENFLPSIDPAKPHKAHFRCDSCGAAIEQKHKDDIVRRGRWIATNPNGDHPSFHLWGRACAPQRDWASIAVDYCKAFGLTRKTVRDESDDALKTGTDARPEQVFFNDVLGLPFERASTAPGWEIIRDRVENADPADQIPYGRIPAGAAMLTAGVDCQDDRTEVHIKAWGRNLRSWTIAYTIIPHKIDRPECWAALDAILKETWKTDHGRPFALQMLAIDSGAFTDDVWDWCRRHPVSRVIAVKGARSQTGPAYAPMKFERKRDGTAKRRQKRGYMVNVSQLKSDFYGWLRIEDPLARGHCGFVVGLGDEFYRQITSEHRHTVNLRSGVTEHVWSLVDPTRRNEALDTNNYAMVAALRLGWRAWTDEQWDEREAEWSAPMPQSQADLFDAEADALPHVARPETPPAEAKARGSYLDRLPT